MQQHQAGNIIQAEELYRGVLALDAANSDALHYLGVICYQRKNYQAAIDFIQKAIGINGRVPSYYSNLGLIFQSMGLLKKAEDYQRQAISLNPAYPEAYNNLGTSLYAQGRLEDAAAAYGQALSVKAQYPEALYNIGIILRDQGKHEEALGLYDRALALRPDYAEAYNNKGFALQELDRHEEAVECYKKALEIKPGYAESLNNLGVAYLAEGKADEAIECYKKAIGIRPDYAEAYNNWGYALEDQRRHDEAVEVYEKAVSLKPDYAEAFNNMGLALKEAGRLDEAVANHKKAAELKPDFAKAHNNIGNVYQQQGKFDLAAGAYLKAIEIQPDLAAAYRNLVSCKKFAAGDDGLLSVIEGFLEKGGLKGEDEGDLHFALGKINDDLGHYEKAFRHYKKANDYETTRYEFDRSKHSGHIDKLIASYTKEYFDERRLWGSGSELPVLIVGMMRSGTTLVEQIIASHPKAFGAGELNFWDEQERKIEERNGVLDEQFADGMAVSYIDHLRGFSPEALRITDKMPHNFMRLGLFHLAFPHGRIIHCKRNPVDSCLSIYFHKFGGHHPFAYDLDDISFFCNEYLRLMEHWRSVLPDEIFLEVQYEELVEDQEGVSRAMLEFCGLKWDDQCLSFHEHDRPVRTASNWQVRQPLYKSSKERWRNYEPFLGPLASFLQRYD